MHILPVCPGACFYCSFHLMLDLSYNFVVKISRKGFSIGVTKLSINLKAKLPIIYLLGQMMCYERAWQDQIDLLYNITKTNKQKKQYRQQVFAAHSTQLHPKMRYINKK